MAVISDIIEGALRHSGSGYEDTRVFIVSEVSGEPSARKWNALNTSGIPRRGDPHPVIPGISVQDIAINPKENDNAIYHVVCEYGGDSEGTAEGLEGSGIKGIEISTSTATIETSKDINGEFMIVTYEGPSFFLTLNSIEPPKEVSLISTSGVLRGEYEISILRAVVTVERNIPSLSENFRVAMKTNDSEWSGGGLDEWLILGVDSSVSGNGKHDWRYQLARAPDRGWSLRGELRNTMFGNPLPSDAVEGNGIEYFQLYERINYDTLGFSIPL